MTKTMDKLALATQSGGGSNLDVTVGCDGGAITLLVRNGPNQPYLHGGYIAWLAHGKDAGAYNQIEDLIKELKIIQLNISGKKEIHKTKLPLFDGNCR